MSLGNCRRFFSASMIVLGAVLEVYFYTFRFSGDGVWLPVSIIVSVALNLLMALAVYNSETRRVWLVLVCTLGLYSVFSTSAGQTFSLLNTTASVGVSESVATASSMNESINADIKRLQTEADGINATMPDDPSYSTTIKRARDRLTAIDSQIATLRGQLSANVATSNEAKKSSIKATNIYEFYGSIGTWDAREWLTFIFHSILSVFIAIMTPIGILTWPSIARAEEVVEPAPAVRATGATESQIREFVNIAWWKIKAGQSNKMIPEATFFDFMKRQSRDFPLDVYRDIVQNCRKSGIIRDDGTAIGRYASQDAVVGKLKEVYGWM